MTVFQLAGLVAVVVFAASIAAAAARGRITRKAALIWLVVWVLAAAAIVRPNATTDIAHLLGIGRGADLVLYTGVLATMGGFFLVYSRLRRLESDLTALVRALALRDANSAPAPGNLERTHDGG